MPPEGMPTLSDVTTDEERLEVIAALAEQWELPRVQEEAVAVGERVAAGQVYVACVGQFKRGKSTLINALIGDPVLPVGIVPVTAVPTVVRYGARRGARVRLRGQTGPQPWVAVPPESVADYVSEERNPDNVRGVMGVEVFAPSPLLAGGLCLVDTPGVGSVFGANTAAARDMIPQIDAVVAVIGADPPLSGDELELIAEAAAHVRHLVFVLNKADRVSEEERRVASEFARAVVERRLGRGVDRIFRVSATERLAGVPTPSDWESLVASLHELVERSGRQLVRDAGRRAVHRLAGRVRGSVREAREALLRPAAESERHLETLGRFVRDGERALMDLDALLGAEQARLATRLSNERSAFLDRAVTQGSATLARDLTRIRAASGPGLRRAMMAAAQQVAHQLLDPWFVTQQTAADRAFRDSMARFVELTNEFLDRLSASGLSALSLERGDLDAALGLGGAPSAFVFNEVITLARPASPLRYAADCALGLFGRRTFERAATAFLVWLLEMNSSRVRSDVDDRIAAARHRLEREVRAMLNEVEARARRALDQANIVRAAGTAAMDGQLARFDATERVLERLVSP